MSGPKRILLTGRPGVGKTTVLLQVVKLLGRAVCGFVTEEWREAGVRMGFRLRTFSGRETVLARRGRGGGPRVGAYGVDLAALEAVGVAELRRARQEDVLVVIDEIGRMELSSEPFRQVVEELFESPRDILATVTRSPIPFVRRLLARPEVELIEVRQDNRDQLAELIATRLRKAAAPGGHPPHHPERGKCLTPA